MHYCWHVNQREPTEFGLFLLRAIANAGHDNPSRFARAAGRDPSVIHRWIYGVTVPTARVLAEVAPALRIPEADLIAAAYSPDPDAKLEPERVPEIVAELAQMLRSESPLSDEDRQILSLMIGRLIEPYRKVMRRRTAG